MMELTKEDRQRNYQFGAFAEEKAMEHYVSRGYALLERNWKLGNSVEIDLIVRIENIVVFVEVKARSGRDTDPIEAVTRDKMRRIARGADYYLKRMQGDLEYRFDIFALTGNFSTYKTEVIEDAFLSPLYGSR